MFNLKGSYFNSHFQDFQETKDLKKFCPADTDLLLWSAATELNEKEIANIIDSAVMGFKTWRKTTETQRVNFLKKFQEIALKRQDEIAEAIAYEVGKPLWEAMTEAKAIVGKVDVTIEDSLKRIKNQKMKNILPEIDGHLIHKPLGPSLVIGPFNFPCHLANGQILSALVAGNTVIFKPSEKTIYSGQILIECFHEAGFPEGVINFAPGGSWTAQKLIESQAIKGVFFTGSKKVGLKIKEATLHDFNKLLALELGGKNSSIVCEDADLEHSVAELIKACFLTTGQRCTSTGTILVHQSILEKFKQLFIETTEKIIVGHPLESEAPAFMGPLIDQAALDAFKEYTKKSLEQGAVPLLPFKELTLKHKGFYVSPSIDFLSVYSAEKHLFTRDEIFAPHCTIIGFSDLDQAISIANNTDYGLAGAVFTKSRANYTKCVEDLDLGVFNFNRSTVGASSKLPFGGVKGSGNFRPAAVSMIDACVYQMSSLETQDQSSKISEIPGLT